MATIRLKLASGGEVVPVVLERADRGPGLSHIVRIGDDAPLEAELELLDGGQRLARLRERVYTFFCHREGERLQIWLNGQVYVLEIVKDTPRRASAAASGLRTASLAAPMPGAVLRILVEPGDTFEASQPLVIMESMKMELTLSVPHAGQVRKVCCQVGELVDLGAVLVELHGPGDDEAP